MRKNVKITVLAQDIIENNYMDAKTCPITRALVNAGYPNLRHYGTTIDVVTEKDGQNDYFICLTLEKSPKMVKLNEAVHQLYKLKESEQFDEIKDFTITLNLKFPDDEKSS